jgi:putative membrane protein
MLTAQDISQVTNAIEAAERRTSGEILVVVAPASDDYAYIPLLWASLAALLLPLPLIFLTRLITIDIFTAQLAMFLVLGSIMSLPALRHRVVPTDLQRLRVERKAAEQFLARNLHTTEARTGVLLFVSLAERRAVIIADDGIASKVTPAIWQAIIDRLTSEIGAGRLASALVNAVGECGDVLEADFPPSPDDVDELPNHLIVL